MAQLPEVREQGQVPCWLPGIKKSFPRIFLNVCIIQPFKCMQTHLQQSDEMHCSRATCDGNRTSEDFNNSKGSRAESCYM